MPERESYVSGTPNWVDLQTTDQAGAKQFYGELLGWTYDDAPVDEVNGVFYSMASLRGRHVGAITPLGEHAAPGVPPHWNSYVSVDDIDATIAKVAPSGGTVVAPPFDVFDSGRMAVVADPAGAVFELWQAKEHIGAALVNEPGTWAWNELITPDIPAATAFYQALFGWGTSAQAEAAASGQPYTEWTLGGQSIGGMMNPPMPGIPPMWGIYFAVDGTDAAVEKTKALGGSVIAEPMDIEPGRFAAVADPQGAMFNVITMTGEVA